MKLKEGVLAYSEKVLDHYNNPRNVGSMSKDDVSVGTGLVGAPECGDVMKLQIKISKRKIWQCTSCSHKWHPSMPTEEMSPAIYSDPDYGSCPKCGNPTASLQEEEFIDDAKFKTFGCGSAIASSSLATEWVKGKTVKEAQGIKNTEIVRELNLPPVKIHCSVLAEDAIKAAIADYRKKSSEK